VPLKGEIDLHVSPTVTAALNDVIDKKPERLVVDLSDVSYIDSAGSRLDSSDAKGGRLRRQIHAGRIAGNRALDLRNLALDQVFRFSRRGCRAGWLI
jgi:Anti-anti-sigma regulatory factor (antagonist of anti-sigma factor)